MRAKRAVGACLLVLYVASQCGAPQAPSTQQQSTTAVAQAAATSSAPAAANGYSYGYGTYYVATRRAVPPNWGNAKTWYANAQAAGYNVGTTPQPGAIAWTGTGAYGQVAIVEAVSANGAEVTISEMNGKGGWSRVTTRTTSARSFRYIYIY